MFNILFQQEHVLNTLFYQIKSAQKLIFIRWKVLNTLFYQMKRAPYLVISNETWSLPCFIQIENVQNTLFYRM